MKKIPCEVWSRTVGYLRPVRNWHDGKKQEFKDRKTYGIGKATVEGASREGRLDRLMEDDEKLT